MSRAPSTTIEFLDAVRAKLGNVSDYKAAAALGVTRATVSSWRKGKTKIGDDQAPKFAEMLELPPEYVFATIAAERAKRTEHRRIWERLAKLAKSAHVLVALGLVSAGGMAPAPSHGSVSANDQYYDKRRRRYARVDVERRWRPERRRTIRQTVTAVA